MVHMPTPDEVIALQQALAEALKRNESLAGQLRVTRAERDLLKEKLSKFTRQLFAASSGCNRSVIGGCLPTLLKNFGNHHVCGRGVATHPI